MDAVLPAVTLVIGYLGALLTEWLREGSAARRERKRRLADEQRLSLTHIQDALQHQARASISLVTARLRRFQDRHEWLRSEEFLVHFESVVEARMPVVTLASRLDDVALRGLIGAFREHEAALAAAPSADEAIEAQARMSDALTAALERAGEMLRG